MTQAGGWSSMTGYGIATTQTPGAQVVVEVRSVNQKNREIRLHSTPKNLAWEHDVQQLLTRGVARGKLDVRIAVEAVSGRGGVSEAGVQRLRGRLYRLSLYLGGRDEALVRELATRLETAPEVGADHVLDTARRALELLCQSRAEEGAGLAEVVRGQRDELAEGLARIEQQRGDEQAALRGRLQEKLAVLRDGDLSEQDRSRLEEEVTYQLIRGDVAEELDRMQLHVQTLDTLLQAASPVGKRLDVLAQEMGREVHTLCAKLADPAAKEIAMQLRPLVDRLREQVQNIE